MTTVYVVVLEWLPLLPSYSVHKTIEEACVESQRGVVVLSIKSSNVFKAVKHADGSLIFGSKINCAPCSQ